MTDRTKRRPGTTAKGELTRAAILRAATPLFAEHGYRGASLASVAEAAGLTLPGLLHHFPSKENLLLSLVEEGYHADGKVLSNRSSEERLRLFHALSDIVDRNQSAPDRVKLHTILVTESIAQGHPTHDYFVERYRKVRRRMLLDLRAGQTAGEIREDLDTELLVPVIVAVMDGLQTQWLLEPDIDMSASFQLFCDLISSVIDLDGPGPPDVGIES